MATLHRETSLLERILTECEDDYVGLWSIYRKIKETGYPDPRGATTTLIHFLLTAGVVEAGTLDNRGTFVPFGLEADDVLRRIQAEWSKLNREPDIGDIAWFTTPVRAT